MKQGFTLIELLVVVLIIGILSSIALPQYTRAVKKARSTEGLTAMKALSDAVSMYHLANGTFPNSLDDLDITMPSLKYHERVHLNDISDGMELVIDYKTPGWSSNDEWYELITRFDSDGKVTGRSCISWNKAGKNCKPIFNCVLEGSTNCRLQ